MAYFFGIASSNQLRVDAAFTAVTVRHPSLAEGYGYSWRGPHVRLAAETGVGLALSAVRDNDGEAVLYGLPEYHRSKESPAFSSFHSSRDAADALIGADGRHLVVHDSTNGEVCIGVDTMGFTPLYVWSDHELLAFASAPGLLIDSNMAPARIDAHGLFCALMFGHMALSRTIWTGVTRPNVGRALKWSALAGTTEYTTSEILPNDAGFTRKYSSIFEEFVDLMKELSLPLTLADDADVALSLSGGMDSRILAGAIRSRVSSMPRSLVFGLRNEDEVRCSSAVASALGSPISVVPPREDLHVKHFRSIARHETLSNTLWSMSFGASLSAFEPLPKLLITGTFGDHTAGGGAADPGYNPITGRYSASRQIEVNNRWGPSPSEVARLFPGQRTIRIIEECLDALASEWSAYPGEEFQRAWLWTVRHRMRFHLAPGGWRQATALATYEPFGTVPMVRFCAGLPLSAMQKRCLETDYLRLRLPGLAALPLDRNSGNLMPLSPTFGYRVVNTIRGAIRSRLPQSLSARSDLRTYHRTFDFDGPDWCAVREALEPVRRDSRICDRSTLEELLPAPSELLRRADSIVDGGKSKSLLAMLFVLNEFGADLSEVTGHQRSPLH